MESVSIAAVQGPGLESPLAGREVRVRGVVTGNTRKGFFVQDPHESDPEVACAVFVFSRRRAPPRGALVELEGTVVDYLAIPEDRPVTQIRLSQVTVLDEAGPSIEPVWLDAAWLDCDNRELARRLDRLEGRVAGVPVGSVFTAPSNLFGDYVVLPPGTDALRTPHGGLRIDPARPLRWLPSFRVRMSQATRVDVGSRLRAPVIGPLNYRAEAFQIVATTPLQVEHATHQPLASRLHGDDRHLTVMTLNGLNLDPTVEDPARVSDPQRDVDDDVADGRYDMLAAAIVEQAGSPDVIALQEIQDDDGAEISDEVSAERNLATLAEAIVRAGGPAYAWIDQPPQNMADGGQPGGNIRNSFLYRLDRVDPASGTVRRIGEGHEAFVDSRKALWAQFRHLPTGHLVAVVNVHLASKRHQRSMFAATDPESDPRAALRVAQAEVLRAALLDHDGLFYVTGDFNDFEFSATLRALCGTDFTNLVDTLPAPERHDYNHRGSAQALMHAVVPRGVVEEGRADYQILHGNQLQGAVPGQRGSRASDHAYVVGRLRLA